MAEVFIISAVRTPVGSGKPTGALSFPLTCQLDIFGITRSC